MTFRPCFFTSSSDGSVTVTFDTGAGMATVVVVPTGKARLFGCEASAVTGTNTRAATRAASFMPTGVITFRAS